MYARLLGVLLVTGALSATAAHAATTTVTKGQEGWGGPTFDFTQTRTRDGTAYFGWDPLSIDSNWSNGTFNFDIQMPRPLSGGDNFDLVIDWDGDGVDSNGDFIVHYANNGSSAGGGWDAMWDAKTYDGGWKHAGPNGLGDLNQTQVTASKSSQQDYSISFSGSDDISFQWLSPLGDGGFPESWTGEAVIIGFWDGGSPEDNVTVAATTDGSAQIPSPAALTLFAVALASVAAVRARLR